jgi:autotransporter strand-loop-strand O-heptosyltransferase
MQIHKSSVSIYDNIVKSEHPSFKHNVKIRFQFDYVPKVVIDFGDFVREPYMVKIVDSKGNVLYKDQISSGYFACTYRRWIENTDIFVYANDGELVAKANLFEKIKTGNVVIAIESSSLGDTLSWVPYINKFIEEHQCANAVVTTFWNHLFEDQYDNFKFRYPGYRHVQNDVVIGIGWYIESDKNYHKVDPRLCPLQKVAADILGVEYTGDIKPRIKKITNQKPTEEKYVCIATESTAGAKYWHHPGGWQNLINMLNAMGYRVIVIHKQNTRFENAINKVGDIDIADRISDLLQCEFFIGIGSGLSWLAWGLDVPVVMISGFSHKFCEFSDKTLRIINENVCHGCFNNTNHKFDKGNWWWCPEHEGTERHFECTKTITPIDVMSKILYWLPTLPPRS